VKLRQRRDTLPSIRKEYQGLRVERDFALEELNSALSQLATVQTLVHRTNPVFQVLERAEPPEKPERSKRLLFGALAGFVALAGSVGWAFLSEVRDTRVREENEIERLGVPVLARIPSGREGAAKHREAYERVAQEVRRRARASGSFCLLVTSTKPREGKSQVVHGVTSTLVDWGEQVLRIDANFREPTGAQPQLERYLSGELEQPTLLKYRSGLYAISCGGHRQDAPALLASSWMDRLIERARASFPVTIVDGAALEPGVDAELLAERVDAVLLVVRTRDVELGSVRRAVERLRKLGTSILGVVMVDSSGADTKRPSERRPAA
jgi:Mrp family chromosome partitioning ATPase